MQKNYILPFMWMKGESQDIIAKELEQIDACGIKAVCLESRPHPDFMGPKWWEDLDFIVKECKKRQMKIWILDDAHFPTGYANGLIRDKYPERKKRYLNYNVVNVWGKRGGVTISVKSMIKPLVSFMDLGKEMDFAERAKNKLVSVTAYPLRDGDKLDESGAMDLTEFVKGDYLDYTFPKDNYRVFVVYETAADGGRTDYINMMDHESVSTLLEAVYEPHYAHLKEEFGTTIAGFFSDEPEIGNMPGYSGDTQIGNPDMPLPWSEELKRRFIERYGESWRTQLAYLWTETVQREQGVQARYDYMDLVSALYRENFCCQLGEWCSAHGVEYIGHVVEDGGLHQRLGSGDAHYFRAVDGQHMAGVDVISNQVIPGDEGFMRSGLSKRDGGFYHYTLAKMGASAGHLDPKKKGRTMCELFGASGWETGVRDMRYILDHCLVRGINYLVPHAFSMAEYPDPDCPPHFYARGKNPQFKYFAKLMKYANRMCDLLNEGQHVANVALLYTAELEWAGNSMQLEAVTKILQQNQVEFDIVPSDMLAQAQKTGNGFSINSQEFGYLIIPQTRGIPRKVATFIRNHPQVKVVYLNQRPEKIYGDAGKMSSVYEGTEGEVVALDGLSAYLKDHKTEKVQLPEAYKDLVFYHYKKDADIFVFHNESAFTGFKGEIALPLVHGAVFYDPMEDAYYKLPVREEAGMSYVKIELPIYHLGVILDRDSRDLPEYQMLSDQLALCNRVKELTGAWEYALSTEEHFPDTMGTEIMETLQPISDIIPEFSGHIFYDKDVVTEETFEKAYLEFTEVYENMELYVNGVRIGDAICPPYIFDVSGVWKAGTNHIRAIVTTTLDRDQANYPEPFIIMDHHVSEPAGLCGSVVHWGRRLLAL